MGSVLDRIDLPGVRDPHHALKLLERQHAIIQAREHLMPFTRFTSPDPEDPDDAARSLYDNQPFHDAVADALETFVKTGKPRQLIFAMPTRHGKTELATKRLAAFYHGLNPSHDIAVGMYNDDIAWQTGAQVRDIVQSQPYKQLFPEYGLKRGGTAKDNLYSVKGGRMVFVGRGGGLTGKGAHLLILDDLFKDFEEARSPTIRDAAWNWFTKVAMTRRMGRKLVIIVMTRWHEDDIIGRLTDPNNDHYSEKVAKKWKIIRLPLLAEEDDPLGRAVGKPLWPDRYDEEYAEDLRDLDPMGFAALQQQRPTVADGILFKAENIRYYNPSELPETLRFYASSDHAVGVKQQNDLTCLLKAGVDLRSDIYLTQCIWERMPSDVVVEFMLDMMDDNMKPLIWWAEKGHVTMSIGPFLYKRMLEREVYGNIIDVTPAKDKAQRAQAIAGRVAQRKVYFPRGEPWVERAVAQLLAFPNGVKDDFVDAFSWLGLGLQSQYRPEIVVPQAKEPAYGTLAWVKMYDQWQRTQQNNDRPGAVGF